jgi:Zn-dependent M16 (insulinase) family peptidase
MRGGAYGASASANGGECLFTFTSYRDPQITKTLDAFADSLAEVAENGITEDTLTKAVIGVVGRDVRPLSPGQRGLIALRRKLYGIDDDLRQAKRDAILAAGPADISRAAQRIHDALGSGVSTVLAGRQVLDRAAEERDLIGKPTLVLPI